MNGEKRFETIIDSKSRLLDFRWKETWHYRDLVLLFVRRDFVAMYKQTILGPVWAVIQPLLTTVAFSFIFGKVAGLAAEGVPTFLFYLAATITWSYFSGCLNACSDLFVRNSGILGKVYFPRIVMPISAVLSKLIDFAIQYIFFICFLFAFLLNDADVKPNIFMLITPLLVIELALLGLGCGIIISSLTTKYRDLSLLVGFAVQIWMFATPVAYDISIVPERLMPFFMINPVTPLILIFRYAYLGIGSIDWFYYMISWLTTAVVLFVGVVLFNRIERTFMDTV